MSRADRIAGLFAVANAAGGAAISIYFFGQDLRGLDWPVVLIVAASLSGAWICAWAWWRQRWALAAAAGFLSLGLPWGYFIVLWGPIVLTLTAAAIVNARRRRAGIS